MMSWPLRLWVRQYEFRAFAKNNGSIASQQNVFVFIPSRSAQQQIDSSLAIYLHASVERITG